MRFFVLGNINAGKSTFATLLHKTLSSIEFYQLLRIDDFRKQYGRGDFASEKIVLTHFKNAVSKSQNAVIELCGFGDSARSIVKILKNNSSVIFHIDSPLSLCLSRIESKKEALENNNYFEGLENLSSTITMIDSAIKDGKLQKNWDSTALAWHTIKQGDYEAILSQLPLKQYHYADKLIVLLKQAGFKQLIAYGSLGRGDMQQHSDIDLILPTKCFTQEVLNRISKNLYEIFDSKNVFILFEKIIILQEECMIELAVVKSIKEYMRYYCGSYIKNIQKTILIGDKRLYQNIEKNMSKYKTSLTYSITHYDLQICLKKIRYYLFFLQKMVVENDIFRFHFYNNLLLDSVVRFLCIKEGKTQYLYCPKHINHIIKKYDLAQLVFQMETTLAPHYEKVQEFLSQNNINT